MSAPPSIAACLAACDVEQLSAFAESHHAAAAIFAAQHRHGEANWQAAVSTVLAGALLERTGEPPIVDVTQEGERFSWRVEVEPETFLAGVARELHGVDLSAAVLGFCLAWRTYRDTLAPTIMSAMLALNEPLLVEWQRRRSPPLVT
jgi:hypothetical protein